MSISRSIIYHFYKKLAKLLSVYPFFRVKFIHKIHNFFIIHLKPATVYIDGHKIKLDTKDSLRLSKTEKIDYTLETAVIKKYIKNGFKTIDIGAHIGYYSLLMADAVGDNGRVFSFEPDPDNFGLLLENISVNGYKNVIVERKAISDTSGQAKLYLSKTSSTDHRIYNENRGENFLIVESIKLDDYFKDKKTKINFVKVDVQGYEPGVILGMKSSLSRNKNVKIISEYWPEGIIKAGFNPLKFLISLSNLGFRFYDINEKENKLIPSTIKTLTEKYTYKNRLDTNIFCVRGKL